MPDITDEEARAFGEKYGVSWRIRNAEDYKKRLTPDGTVILGQADPGVWSDHLDQPWVMKDGQLVHAFLTAGGSTTADPSGKPFKRAYHPHPYAEEMRAARGL